MSSALTAPLPHALPVPRRRAVSIALWALQIALAAMFAGAGISKLTGVAPMIAMYDAIGVGHWFRYVTGLMEVGGAVLLIVPAVATFGALALAGVMVGAIMTHLFVLGPPFTAPVMLLLGLLVVVFVRRAELAAQVKAQQARLRR